MKKIFSQIKSEIDKSSRILLSFHNGPDGDSAGSNLAMHEYLTSIGKKVDLIKGESPFPNYLSTLPNFDQVIAKSIDEIDISKYDLLLAIDSSTLRQLTNENFVPPKNLKIVIIDHHRSNDNYGILNYVDTSRVSASEIVAEFIYSLQKKFTYSQAANLMIGIYHDSGGFKYPLTSDKTFLIASKLTKACPDFGKYIFQIENSHDKEMIRVQAAFLSNISEHFNNKVVISSLSFAKIKKLKLDLDKSGGQEIANLLKSVVGWEIAIRMVETVKNKTNVSIRRRDNDYDLAKITVNTGFGGGHSAAAGATLPYPMVKAKKYLLKIIQQTYPELGEP